MVEPVVDHPVHRDFRSPGSLITRDRYDGKPPAVAAVNVPQLAIKRTVTSCDNTVLARCQRPGRAEDGVVVHQIATGERLIAMHDVAQLDETLSDPVDRADAKVCAIGTEAVLSPVVYSGTW